MVSTVKKPAQELILRRGVCSALSDDAAGADVPGCVPAFREARDLDAGAGIGRMDEFTASDVHADVGSGRAAAEEDEITGNQAVIGDVVAVCELSGRGAVDAVAELAVDVLHKAGAVKAGGRSAAVDVRITDERHAVIRDLRAK